MSSAARRAIIVLFAALAVAVVSSASGASSSADIGVNILFVKSPGADPSVLPNGASFTVTGLAFQAGMSVANDVGPDPATVHVRFELPPGLHWGSDLPDPAENCTSTATSGDCTPPELPPHSNERNLAAAWAWDIVADAPGSYLLRASVVSATTPDPDTSNHVASVALLVESKAPW